MERNLFKYIWQNTRRDQLWILTIVLISFPIYFLSLDLPKQIVNGPIQGSGFANPADTVTYLRLTLPFTGDETNLPIEIFGGFEMDRFGSLFLLSFLFLGLVCMNGLFKFYINTFKGRLGERMLRRLRYQLIDRLLRFPLPHFRRVRAPEMATMVKDEVEPLGGFIGDAFVSPVFLGGQALTAMIFILAQSVPLGLMAAGIIAVQILLIPRLRRRLLVLGRARQLSARALAGRVGEIVDGMAEVHANDTSNYERAELATRLGRIFEIRYEFYQRKFFIKFLNNFLAQVTPFLFYFVGGYFALTGQLDIGQLVAVIAAYKDLPSPIKELIDWDQRRLDINIKYSQVVDQFEPGPLMPEALQAHDVTVPARLPMPIGVNALAVTDDTGARLLEGVSFSLEAGERVAAVGDINAGAETAAEVLARMQPMSGGRVRFGDQALSDIPEAVTGQRVAYLGADTYLPNRSLAETLVYSLRHRPGPGPERDAASEAEFTRYVAEARRSGNPQFDYASDWTDYEGAGLNSPEALGARLRELLAFVDLEDDIFQLGLRAKLPADTDEATFERVLEARAAFIDRLAAEDMEQLVEPFDPTRYHAQSTIGENLLFGTALDAAFDGDALSANKAFLELLVAEGLDEALYHVGISIAETTVELFADLPPENPLFERLTFMRAEDVPAYNSLLQRLKPLDYEAVSAARRARVWKLAFTYIEPQHRFGLLSEDLQQKIVQTRHAVREAFPERSRADNTDEFEGPGLGPVAYYDPEQFNLGATLADNILFGRISYGIADAGRRVRDLIQRILDELEMGSVVFDAGLTFEVGTGGKRLTAAQRQKIGLARALLKRPDLLIVNRGLSALGGSAQADLVAKVVKRASGMSDAPHVDGSSNAASASPTDETERFGIFWVLMAPELATHFDRLLVFEDGQIKHDGQPDAAKDDAQPVVGAADDTIAGDSSGHQDGSST